MSRQGNFATEFALNPDAVVSAPWLHQCMAPQAYRRGTASLRAGRTHWPGHFYLVTTCCLGRTRYFDDPLASLAAATDIRESTTWLDARLHEWVLMPDHSHGIVELGRLSSLSDVVASFKGRTARSSNLRMNRQGPLWQRGFHDRAIRSELELETMSAYVRDNPRRAGLVELDKDWPFGGSGAGHRA